jgi:pimeloyl-ACP methyl ester carboxylesterase
MPVSVAEDTAAALGDAASVVVVPGSGHFVWYENPGAVREALDTFLATTT